LQLAMEFHIIVLELMMVTEEPPMFLA